MGRDGGADDPVRHTGAVRPGRLPWLQLCLDGAPQVTERCLLLDVQMPEMEDLQLQGRLAAVGVELPSIVVSGQADVTTTVRAMKAGAVDFIEKPYEADRLVEAIESAMAKAGRPTIRRQAAKAAARMQCLARASARSSMGSSRGASVSLSHSIWTLVSALSKCIAPAC